jgi:hypothetical protein
LGAPPGVEVEFVFGHDSGKAIVGHLLQHASVIVTNKPRTERSRKRAARPARKSPSAWIANGSPGMSHHLRNTCSMLASPRCGAKTRRGGACRSPAVRGKRRCRMHGGAPNSGAPRRNRNARKHGRFTKRAINRRKQIEVLLKEARALLRELK